MAEQTATSAAAETVEVRTLLMARRPLLIISLPDTSLPHPATAIDARVTGVLLNRLHEAGVEPIVGFLGHPLVQGAKVGFTLAADEVRLVDERDQPLVRWERSALDPDWLAAARRLHGTMLVVVRGVSLASHHDERALARLLDEAASQGRASGAVVGVAEPRLSLPLMFG